jgi:uncharacterized membrane protein (UPF0127 family)
MNACRFDGLDEPEPDAWLEIRGQRVSIEIADTPKKQQKGLGERDSLAWDHGMYFEYSQPAFHAFWMKGMRFSIDIIWLRNDRIVGIEANIPFEKGGNGPTVRPRELTDAVLEVPAGYSAASGWTIGDPVHSERVKAN